jgi:hypothetical protein
LRSIARRLLFPAGDRDQPTRREPRVARAQRFDRRAVILGHRLRAGAAGGERRALPDHDQIKATRARAYEGPRIGVVHAHALVWRATVKPTGVTRQAIA